MILQPSVLPGVRVRWRHGVCLGVAAWCVLVASLRAQPADQGPSILIGNDDWEIVVTTAGYSDLLFDKRAGFRKREFLSGEWAAAVCFDKGGETRPPTWLQKQWIAPDWVSNSDFWYENDGAFKVFISPTNPEGLVFESSITNDCLRVVIQYEMIDTETGIEMGTQPRSSAEVGTSVTSTRFALRQTYRFENISGQELTNFKFFQFLHGLESAVALYDDREYGDAPYRGYRYDITQEGESFSFNTLNGDIVVHHDVIGFHSDMMPGAFEVGYYGKPPEDNHEVGKPTEGVHLDVETDRLDSTTDYFAPLETRWVGGALRFDLGTIPVDGSITRDVLLTLQTGFQSVANISEVEVLPPVLKPGNILEIEIVDNLMPSEPIPFFIGLFKSTTLVPLLNEDNQIDFEHWSQVNTPLHRDNQTGSQWFEVALNPEDPLCYFAVTMFLDNSPELPAPGQ